MKKLIGIFVALSVIIVLTAASCGGSGGSGGTGGNGGTGTVGSGGTGVHMGETTFLQSSVTISKGSSLNLIDDVPVLHIIGNGSWVKNVAQPAREPGAPTVNNVQISSAGQSITVGPFNTAGTYHLYCSVHLNMNLTVIVQ
jgi:plastocyanin